MTEFLLTVSAFLSVLIMIRAAFRIDDSFWEAMVLAVFGLASFILVALLSTGLVL